MLRYILLDQFSFLLTTWKKVKTCYYDGHIQKSPVNYCPQSMQWNKVAFGGFISMNDTIYLINAFDHTQNRYDMVKLQSFNLDIRHELACDVFQSKIRGSQMDFVQPAQSSKNLCQVAWEKQCVAPMVINCNVLHSLSHHPMTI